MFEQHAVARQQFINEVNVNDAYANRFSPQFAICKTNF
jgi:hypothetical protein